MTEQDVEAERLVLLAKARTETPVGLQEGWEDACELMDRAFLAQDFFDDKVKGHVSCLLYPELYKLASEVSDKMFEFYQAVGNRV